ncbi:hypothetical protein N658DRAFT_182529 [Parathielavia hyrcaniae]|uniref:Uncharacterized protein n=1 Tax=Parathielavia hyrcaniae TaxID=113614 RepID=A0AAN6Q6M7_9PEZI|nr:hypothetical protein N658DRAFT_182529 [Parathielavia hyrcaniae]
MGWRRMFASCVMYNKSTLNQVESSTSSTGSACRPYSRDRSRESISGPGTVFRTQLRGPA